MNGDMGWRPPVTGAALGGDRRQAASMRGFAGGVTGRVLQPVKTAAAPDRQPAPHPVWVAADGRLEPF